MSAREKLIETLNEEHNPTYWGGDPRDAEALVDAYAHELAEKIRYTHHPDRQYLDAFRAADLIDPEVDE